MEEDQREVLTNDDDELIDQRLLNKIAPDTISTGSDFRKLTSRRGSGANLKSVDQIFKERI